MFEARLAEVQGLIEAHLRSGLSGLGGEPLHEAMTYASAGGKRLRAFLVMEGARVYGLADAVSIRPAMSASAWWPCPRPRA